MSLDPEVKAKWVQALRSGAYRQGIGALKRGSHSDPKKCQYCCLGVLCEVLELPNKLPVDTTRLRYMFTDPENPDHTGSQSYLSGPIRERIGLSWDDMDKLIDMNDDEQKSFEEIADYIEENL